MREALKPVHLQVDDTSGGCGASFKIVVVSESFEGLKLLDRQRLVHDALSKHMGEIHALEMRCLPPSRWKKE